MLPFLIQYYQNHSFYSIIAIVLYFIFYALYGLYIQHFVIIFRPAIYSTFCDNISSSIVWSILSVQCFIVVSPYNKRVLLPPLVHICIRHIHVYTTYIYKIRDVRESLLQFGITWHVIWHHSLKWFVSIQNFPHNLPSKNTRSLYSLLYHSAVFELRPWFVFDMM